MYSMLLVQDETFRTLNIPISPEDRKEMDRKIKKGDAVPPVLYWKGRILTGYEQNEIALKYHRYYITSREMFFPRKSDAVAWLCHEQLKRNDLVWPAKAWLIYRLHEALRDIAGREAAKEDFQYKQFSPSSQSNAESLETDRENVSVLRKLGNEFNYNKETIRRYVRFGRQLDKLEEMVPGARIKILTGSQVIIMSHMPALMRMPKDQLEKMINDKRTKRLLPAPEYYARSQHIRTTRPKSDFKYEPGIQQMPKYDPDAELNGLRYTVGAWRKAITRTAVQANLSQATETGKEDLKQVLQKLITEAQTLCRLLEDKKDDRP